MSTWFQDRRQEFIAATLRQFGQIRRADIMRQFDLSEPQASKDIAAFLANDPPFVSYDTTAKAYVLNQPPKEEPDCAMCDGTGFKDHASFSMDPCDHQQGDVANRALQDVQHIGERIAGGHRASISSINKLSKHVRTLAAELAASRTGQATTNEGA